MAIDLVALKDEIEQDPEKLGYAPLMERGSDADVAHILNDKAGNGAALYRVASLPRDSFLYALLPATFALATKSAAVQSKWDRILSVVRSVQSIPLSNDIMDTLYGLVVDGLATPEEIDAIGKIQGSRAEILFGQGTIIHHLQVAAAFGRGTGP